MKYVLPSGRVISKLPDYQLFGRQPKLRINPESIPNLKWKTVVTVYTNYSSVNSKLDSAMSDTSNSHNTLYCLAPQSIACVLKPDRDNVTNLTSNVPVNMCK